MAVSRKLKKQLEALADRFVPDVRRAFIASIRDVSETAMLGAIIDAIREGDLEKAFRATGLSPAAMRPVTSMIEQAFEAGGVTVSNSLPNINSAAGPTIFRFDVRNSRAEAWLRDQSSGLVTRIGEQTRTNIQTIVQAGMRDGRNPRAVALDIIGRMDGNTGRRTGGIIGLTDQQARWVANARRELTGVPNASYFTRERRDMRFDSIVRRAIRDSKPLEAGKVDALVGRYSDSLLQLRGETIARTEMLQALAKSQDEAIRQAIDTGTINPRHVTKKWDATGDKRTRPSHAAMDGQSVGMDEAFTTPDGAKLMIPGDASLGAPASEIIACRCRVDYDIDFLAGLEGEYDPPPAPSAPVEAPEVRNARLDQEQKDYVVRNGQRANREFLTSYDNATGEAIAPEMGSVNHVTIPDTLMALYRDPMRSITSHHNHPGSSSFSPQDLSMVSDMPGLKGLWAHGHNGSSFYAEKGTDRLNRTQYDAVDRTMRNIIWRRVTANNASQVNLLYHHIVMSVLARNGYFRYDFTLAGESLQAYEANKSWVDPLIASVDLK